MIIFQPFWAAQCLKLLGENTMSNNLSFKKEKKVSTIPQFRVSTNLHGGASLEACQNAMKDWQTNYYKWYDQVNTTKPTPCNNL